MKILFNEIAQKCIFSALRAFGVTCFFNIVAPGGVMKFLSLNWRGHKNIAEELHDPPYSKENGGPLK